MHTEFEHLPVALAADEDAHGQADSCRAWKRPSPAGKTVCFAYPSGDGGSQERTLDPYSLFLIQGHWYVVGYDHMRDDDPHLPPREDPRDRCAF